MRTQSCDSMVPLNECTETRGNIYSSRENGETSRREETINPLCITELEGREEVIESSDSSYHDAEPFCETNDSGINSRSTSSSTKSKQLKGRKSMSSLARHASIIRKGNYIPTESLLLPPPTCPYYKNCILGQTKLVPETSNLVAITVQRPNLVSIDLSPHPCSRNYLATKIW